MNKKIFIPILGLVMFSLMVGSAKAQVAVSVEIRDASNYILNGQTVLINTVAYAYGHYEDTIGNAQATAKMEVYYSTDGVSYVQKAVIFNGIINDGETKLAGTYTMNELGYYQFRWTCQIIGASTWCQETAQARTKITLITPEPGTIAGLLMGLIAFGLLAFKKTRAK
jgi:hypothetical protein